MEAPAAQCRQSGRRIATTLVPLHACFELPIKALGGLSLQHASHPRISGSAAPEGCCQQQEASPSQN
jgi:hypothetical protein